MELLNQYRLKEQNLILIHRSTNYLETAFQGLLKFLRIYLFMILIKYLLHCKKRNLTKIMQFRDFKNKIVDL